MKKIISLILVLTMALALTVGLASCGKDDSDSQTINIGYMPNYASLWAVMTGIKKGYFEEEGINVVLTEFQDGPSEIAAMNGGSVDLAYIGKGAHKLCIKGQATIFAPSSVHTEDKLVCTAASGIKTVQDLKGKKIGYTTGSSSETTMNAALAAAGLTLDDVTAMNLSASNIVSAFLSGDIDVAVTWNPYSTNCLKQEGSYEITFESGSTNMSSWICLPGYEKDHKDILVRYARALYKAMDYGADPAHADEVAGWCAEQTKTSKDSMLLQWGDAHWFNLQDMKDALENGQMQKYYEGVESDFLNTGDISESDVNYGDTSKWVLYDIMKEALNG